MTENIVQEVIFHCARYKELILTVVPYGMKNEMGHKMTAKHLHFGPDIKLGAGILRCKTAADAEFVRSNEYFLSGKIIEVTDVSDIPVEPIQDKVQGGAHNTRDTKKDTEPADGKRAVKAARVPAK